MQTRGLSLGLTLREVKNKACNLIDAEVPDTLLPGLCLKEPPKSALTSQQTDLLNNHSEGRPADLHPTHDARGIQDQHPAVATSSAPGDAGN